LMKEKESPGAAVWVRGSPASRVNEQAKVNRTSLINRSANRVNKFNDRKVNERKKRNSRRPKRLLDVPNQCQRCHYCRKRRGRYACTMPGDEIRITISGVCMSRVVK
jgi:hypothetical protein